MIAGPSHRRSRSRELWSSLSDFVNGPKLLPEPEVEDVTESELPLGHLDADIQDHIPSPCPPNYPNVASLPRFNARKPMMTYRQRFTQVNRYQLSSRSNMAPITFFLMLSTSHSPCHWSVRCIRLIDRRAQSFAYQSRWQRDYKYGRGMLSRRTRETRRQAG